MFAILLNKSMDPFYQNISSFPTAIFTILLCVCFVYWLGAVVGLVDIDVLNFDTDIDLNADSPHSTPDVLAGLMLRFGLVGIPVVITLSLIILVGWFVCYYLAHFLLGYFDNWIIRFVLGLPIIFVSTVAGMWVTSKLIIPLKPLFKNALSESHKHILGQRAVVRTSRVDNNFGEATLDDGGAGLILKIRSSGDETFEKGDRVVIFEKLKDVNTYRVMSEDEFSGR